MSDLWKIHLFKGLRVVRATHAGQEISRFRTHKTGALLAFLAFYPQPHAREVLSEMLWPDSDPRSGGQNLRTALASLRRQLEPPDVPEGSVLFATRTTLQINPNAIQTDVANFQAAAQAARLEPQDSENKIALLERAMEYYDGALLPGFYEEWIGIAARRLEEEYFSLLQELLGYLETARDLPRAIHFACEGIHCDPARTETRAALKRFCRDANISFESLNLPGSNASAAQSSKPVSIKKKPRRKKKLPPQSPSSEVIAPVPAATAPSVSLPARLNRFFGREAEVARVYEEFSVRQTRLLTLTGIGGSGKTRLAIEAAYQMSQTSQLSQTDSQNPAPTKRAVFYVSLADLRDSDLILSAVLEVLGLPRAKGFLTGVSPEARPADRLCAALSTYPTLLVLDNFEHLAATGAQFVEMLLSRVPDLQILVTSQQRLNIPGERQLPVGALPIPSETLPLAFNKETLPALLEYSSVALFLDRAQAVAPDFQLTSHNAASIAEICCQLEGVPLAIELAGARCNVFTPAQIALRLRDVADKFATLTNIRRPATPRHASLTTAISWSYELLPPELAHFWAQLSVFRGGFSFESAQEVCEQPNAPHWLAQLRASSLLSVEEQGGEMRFRLLEMLREFAGEQLEKTPDHQTHQRHAAHFEGKLSDFLSSLRTSQESEALFHAAAETDNARAALEWARTEYSALAARLGLALGTLLQRRGLHTEALATAEIGLNAISENDLDLRLDLLREHAGVLLDLQQWQPAAVSAREMLAICRQRKDQARIAFATNLIGLAAKGEQEWKSAREYFVDALAQFEKLEDISGIAIARNNLGLIEYLDGAGDKKQARQHLQTALELRCRLDDARGTAEAHINLGALAQQVQETDEAQSHYEAALKIELELRHTFGVGRALCNLGEIAETRGEIQRAYRLYISAHSLFELAGVAYQKYSAIQSARLAGEIADVTTLIAQARQFSRSGALRELVFWANE